MINSLFKPATGILFILGLLAPTAALCLPAPQHMSCCAEPCSGKKTASKDACCRPAIPAKLDERIVRPETIVLTADIPSLLPSQGPVSLIVPALLSPFADASPQIFSGLSPPLPA